MSLFDEIQHEGPDENEGIGAPPATAPPPPAVALTSPSSEGDGAASHELEATVVSGRTAHAPDEAALEDGSERSGGAPHAPDDDVLHPDEDEQRRPVGIDRKVVLAGLLIAGTVLCLILAVFGGGGGAAAPDARAAAPPTPPPGAYIDEATAGYYDDAALDPSAPVSPSAADPYAAQAYGGGTYGSYGSSAYGSQAPAHGYATTQAYTSAPSSPASLAPASRPTDPAWDAFERAVASPLMAGSSAPAPAAPPVPEGLTPEQAQELTFMREVTGMIPSGAPPVGAAGYGPLAAGAPAASAASAASQRPTDAAGTGAPAGPGHATRAAFLDRVGRSPARSRPSGATEYDVVVRPSAPAALALRAGSVIPAALVTGMDSNLPGTVIAQITRNVYDSATQRDLLIPAGTRLVGEYDDQIAYGQNRALVAWTQMLFPDGTAFDLPGLPGADLQGYAGLDGRVDRHYGRVFGSALMLAAVGTGVALAAPNQTGFDLSVSPQEVASRQIAIELSRIATEVVRRDLRVEPTIRVAPGHRFYVMLARDLPFAGPYRPRADVGRFPRPATR